MRGPREPPLLIGVDLGTQGARALAASADGAVLARAAAPIATSRGPGGSAEQDPEAWWAAASACLRAVCAELGPRRAELAALSVTATSGTICLLDGGGRPLRPALLYSDSRAAAEAELVCRAADGLGLDLGHRPDPSFGLPKLLWLSRHEPAALAAASHVAHAADLIVGRLSGDYGVSDWSHALKTGYDLGALAWPAELLGALSLPKEKLPRVVAPGTPIAAVGPGAAASGLPAGLPIVAGMTDGCAAQIAGGAAAPGEWLSVLGSTLVLKGVSQKRPRDPGGRLYAHRHPEGHWLPGAASAVGGVALAARYPGADLGALDAAAAALSPTGLLCYPLEGRGERFPFRAPAAEGFTVGQPASPAAGYAAVLEGVAYLERLCYETLEGLGCPAAGPVRAAGGGARSPLWLQIRADLLGRPLIIPAEVGAAFGAAVIAASAVAHPGLVAATRAMVRQRGLIEPGPAAGRYEEPYRRFVAALRERGYLG